jgi:hypothetical protein
VIREESRKREKKRRIRNGLTLCGFRKKIEKKKKKKRKYEEMGEREREGR